MKIFPFAYDTLPKAFASKLLLALYKRFGMGEYFPYGTANDLLVMCLSLMEDHPDTIIVIDEIDYALRHPQLLVELAQNER